MELPVLTEKQNQCLIAYLTNGHKKAEAYRSAYDCDNMNDASVYVEASRFFSNPTITPWIDYYTNNVAQTLQEKLNYDAAKHFDELNEMKEKALKCKDRENNPNVSVALKAVELKGKLAGLYNSEKDELNANNSVTIMGKIIVDGEEYHTQVGEHID